MLDTLFWLAVGVFLGWVVIPQPAWAAGVYSKIIAFVKSKFTKAS